MAKKLQARRQAKVEARGLRKETKKESKVVRKEGKRIARIERKDLKKENRFGRATRRRDQNMELKLEKLDSRTERGLARTEALAEVGSGDGVQSGFAAIGRGVGSMLNPIDSATGYAIRQGGDVSSSSTRIGDAEMRNLDINDPDSLLNSKPKDNKMMLIFAAIAVVLFMVFKKK